MVTLELPLLPPSSLQAVDGLLEGGCLQPLAQLHKGPVSSIHLNPATGRLLTAGLDGALHVMPLDGAAAAAGAAPFRAGGGWGGFSQARWADSHTFVTVSGGSCCASETSCCAAGGMGVLVMLNLQPVM